MCVSSFLSSLALHLIATIERSEASHWTCNPYLIGELRNWKNRSRCLDVDGYSGQGNVLTFQCDGGQDQMWAFCDDGSIRNLESQWCLDIAGGSGEGNIGTAPCEFVSGTLPDDQKWEIFNMTQGFDPSGFWQKIFRILSPMRSECLDVAGNDGIGDVGTYSCEAWPQGADQFFYVRNRGRPVGHGVLVNAKSQQCLDVAGDDGRGSVDAFNCDGSLDQVFTMYENGEIVDAMSHECLDMYGSAGDGNVDTSSCEDAPKQKWNKTLCTGSDCQFFSLASQHQNWKCLDVAGSSGFGNVDVYQCSDEDDQKWSWSSGAHWESPIGSWKQVACNQNGDIQQTVTSSVTQSHSHTLSEETKLDLKAEMDAGVVFAKAKTSVEVSQSIANSWTWSTSSANSQSVTTDCRTYDDGQDFKGGCMWQWHVSVSSTLNNIDWDAPLVTCSRSTSEPRCPPFTTWADGNCIHSVNLLNRADIKGLSISRLGLPIIFCVIAGIASCLISSLRFLPFLRSPASVREPLLA